LAVPDEVPVAISRVISLADGLVAHRPGARDGTWDRVLLELQGALNIGYPAVL